QLALEAVMDGRAVADGQAGIVYDRGLADGAAYLRGGIEELADITHQSPSNILGRYGLVIHLVTSAKQSRGYQKHTNEHRFEDAQEAVRLDDMVQGAWDGHPNRVIINLEDTAERNHAVTT